MSEPAGPGGGALPAGEARFRDLFERAPIGLAQVDPQGRILATNTALQEILGYDEDELRRMTFLDITHPQDRVADSALFEEVLAGTRDTYGMDKRYLRKDGEIVWGHLAVSATRGPSGTPLSIVGMLLDITGRRQAEEQNRLHAHLLDTVGQAVIATDQGGTITYWNRAAEALYGWPAHEALGRSASMIIPPGYSEREVAEIVDRVHAGGVWSGEFVVQARDGHIFPVLVTNAPIRDPLGLVVGTVGVSVDISDRKRTESFLAEAKVAAEELARVRQEQAEEADALSAVSAALAGTLEPVQLYRVILEQAARLLPFDHAVIALYQDGWVISGASLGGPEITPGTRIVPINPRTSTWQALSSGRPIYIADSAEVPDWNDPAPWRGPHRVRCMIVVPLYVAGELMGSFQVNSRKPHFYTQDHIRIAIAFGERAAQAVRNARLFAAEQARALAAEELATLRSDFVSAVSHELRTPLTAIVGFGELLLARWGQMSEARRLGRIAQIVQSANRQKRLVEDLLLAGRLEGAKLLPRREIVSVPVAVQQAVAEVQGSYPGQRVVLQGPPGLHVLADAAHAAQVLANLLDNAAKYSPEGSPIGVAWCREGEMAVVRVTDRGAGVPAQGRDQLFTRFGRLAGSATRAGRVGTGLGLFISRGMAEAMGGDLDLEATGPGGSTFRLRLPHVPEPDARSEDDA